jgi:hypothetical protein
MMPTETPNSEIWAVLAYLRTLHELLDWAPVGAVPKRQAVIGWRREWERACQFPVLVSKNA